MDAQTKMIFGSGASLRTRGLQKVQKIDKDCFSVKSYKGLDWIHYINLLIKQLIQWFSKSSNFLLKSNSCNTKYQKLCWFLHPCLGSRSGIQTFLFSAPFLRHSDVTFFRSFIYLYIYTILIRIYRYDVHGSQLSPPIYLSIYISIYILYTKKKE